MNLFLCPKLACTKLTINLSRRHVGSRNLTFLPASQYPPPHSIHLNNLPESCSSIKLGERHKGFISTVHDFTPMCRKSGFRLVIIREFAFKFELDMENLFSNWFIFRHGRVHFNTYVPTTLARPQEMVGTSRGTEFPTGKNSAILLENYQF